MTIPTETIQTWELAVDCCAVSRDCGKVATTERHFDWRVAGATFLNIYLRLCDDHAMLLDAGRGKPFPVTCVITEEP